MPDSKVASRRRPTKPMTMKSTSLPGPASPRATDPNTKAMPIFPGVERRLQHPGQSVGFENERTQIPMDGMVRVGPVIHAIAILPGDHEANSRQASKLLLHRSQ